MTFLCAFKLAIELYYICKQQNLVMSLTNYCIIQSVVQNKNYDDLIIWFEVKDTEFVLLQPMHFSCIP